MSHKKKTVGYALTLILSGALLFTSCSGDQNAANPDGKVTAEPDGKEYTFQYPDSWQVLRSDSMIAIASPEGGKANITVAGYTLPDTYTTLSDYVHNKTTGYIHYLKENFGDRIEVSEETSPEYTVADHDSVCLIYHIKIGEDDYHFATVLTVLPTVGSPYLYEITYTAADEAVYDEHIGVFRDALQSFTFR